MQLRAEQQVWPSAQESHLGIGDDAALFRPRRGYETVLTCDWFLEGTHFIRDKHPADAVGWKSLARAVSDIAAMGARTSLLPAEPRAPRVPDRSLARRIPRWPPPRCPQTPLPTRRRRHDSPDQGAHQYYRSRRSPRQSCRASLRSPPRRPYLCQRPPRRRLTSASTFCAGKRPVPNLSPAMRSAALKKHLYPEPRLALAHWLTDRRLVTSMMDLSDGLSSDLPRLCAASKVGAHLDATQIPAVAIPKMERSAQSQRPRLRPERRRRLRTPVHRPSEQNLAACHAFQGRSLTAIGKITRNRALLLTNPDGRTQPIQSAGWDPFRP